MTKRALTVSFDEILKVKFWHVYLAFLLALAIPALWTALEWNAGEFDRFESGRSTFESYLKMLWKRFWFLYVIGYFLASTFGLSIFYILRKHIPFNLWIVCIIAALIAIFPNVFIEILSLLSDRTGDFSFRQGSCMVIEHHHRTACGWRHFWVDNILDVAFRATLAGGIFWAILARISKYQSNK